MILILILQDHKSNMSNEDAVMKKNILVYVVIQMIMIDLNVLVLIVF